MYYCLIFIFNIVGSCGTILARRDNKHGKKMVNCSWGCIGALMLSGLALLTAMAITAVVYDDYCYSLGSYFSNPKLGNFNRIKESFLLIDQCVANPSSILPA